MSSEKLSWCAIEKLRRRPAQCGGKWGFIDRAGNAAIGPQYDAVRRFSEGLAAVSVGGKHGFIDKTGKATIEPVFMDAGDFSECLAPVKTCRAGYIDKQGQVAIKLKYDAARPFSEGLALVRDGDRWAFINTRGEVVIEGQYAPGCAAGKAEKCLPEQ